jgi:biopolymer transport protein ExbB
MRLYASSKYRIFLLAGLLGLALFTATSSFGQEDAAPATPAAAPVGTEPKAEAMGLFSLIMQNVDFVFIIIAVLSVIGLTLIIQGFIKNREAVMMPEETTSRIRDMIEQRKFKELIDFTENDPSFISRAINPALKRAPSFSSMKEAMETSLGEQTAEQFRKIEYLNIIGNLGPLLGLLGTVLGMIEAFSEVAAAGGQANVGVLSGGISKALAHTFLGLLLAVPCLACFGILRTMVDRLTVRGALISEELLLMIKPAEAKPAAIGVTAPRPGVPQPGVVPPPPVGRKAPTPAPQT